jgi:NDP-sugar pyrophosphorylase family protein
MKALIFAAGKGVRMMPLTAEKPKPLLELMGKSLLERVFDTLPEEITEVVLVVGYRGEMIRDKFGDSFNGRKITYVEQKEQLGTGNALMACRSNINPGEYFLIIYADDIHDKEVIAAAVRKGNPAIFVARVQYPERFGVVVVNEEGRILGLEEAPKEPKTDLAVTGAYFLNSDIFDYSATMDPRGEYLINSMLLPYMRDHNVHAEIENVWIPVGFPEDLKKAEIALSSH